MIGDGLGWYDRKGQPITLERWAELKIGEDYMRIAQDTIGDRWVSTVWLGLDHGFGRHGPPIIFETMIFPIDGGEPDFFDDYMLRYATEDEALAGHEAICAEIRVLGARVSGDSRDE